VNCREAASPCRVLGAYTSINPPRTCAASRNHCAAISPGRAAEKAVTEADTLAGELFIWLALGRRRRPRFAYWVFIRG
jgi:hypothetical protein